MYRKVLLCIVTVLICLIITGCCKFKVLVDVKENGGADLTITAVGASLIQNKVNEMGRDLQHKGFNVTDERDGKMQGFRAKKTYDEFNDLTDLNLFGLKNKRPQIAHFKNYIADRYFANIEADFTENQTQTDRDELRNIDYKKFIDANIQFNMPFNFGIEITNGKGDFTPEKKFIRWELDVTKNNSIMFMATDWHKDRIIALLIAGLILAGISYQYKKKITGENQANDIANSNVYKLALIGAVGVCGFLLWQYMSIPSDINTAYAKRNVTKVESQAAVPHKVDKKTNNKQDAAAAKVTEGDFPDSFKDRGVILGDQTFVYKEPIKSSKILTKLNKNEVVGIKEEFKGFYFIMTKDKTLGCVEVKDCMKIKK